jgi:hypothetical protein
MRQKKIHQALRLVESIRDKAVEDPSGSSILLASEGGIISRKKKVFSKSIF